MVNYLEKKQIQLDKRKERHQLSLQRYSLKLEEKNGPKKEEKINKRTQFYQKDEERFWTRAEKTDKAQKNRIWEIDLLRALVIIGMIVSHLFTSFGSAFPKMFDKDILLSYSFFKTMYEIDRTNTSFIFTMCILRYVGILVLVLLIGINTAFSRNNLKRAIILAIVGALESAFFVFAAHYHIMNYVIMGTITSFAVCLFIYIGIEAIFSRFEKAWKWICLGIGVTGLIVWGFVRYQFVHPNPNQLYNNFWLVYHGYASSTNGIWDIKEFTFLKVIQHIFGITAFGQDYLGVFPWLNYLFIGAFIGQTVYKDRKSLLHYLDKEGKMTWNEKLNRVTKPLLFFGHKTLIIYVVHQPIVNLIFIFICAICLKIPTTW